MVGSVGVEVWVLREAWRGIYALFGTSAHYCISVVYQQRDGR